MALSIVDKKKLICVFLNISFSLSWVKDFEIGFDDKEEKTWQIYITYVQNKAPSIVELKKIFGVHIVSFVTLYKKKPFKKTKNVARNRSSHLVFFGD